VVWLPGDRICDAVALLARVTLTHRLSLEEAASGIVDANPDLLAICALADESVPLHAGGRMTIEIDLEYPRERVQGPAGWLAAAAAGDLVGLPTPRGGHAPGDGQNASMTVKRPGLAHWYSSWLGCLRLR